MKSLLFLALTLLALACNTPDSTENPSPNTEAQIVGRWNMARVYDDGQDVTDAHNPAQNRWIEFGTDGTFVSDGDPYGSNTGRWTFDETLQELALDSDSGEGDDSYWIVHVEGNEMRWTGSRSEFTKRFELVHVRPYRLHRR